MHFPDFEIYKLPTWVCILAWAHSSLPWLLSFAPPILVCSSRHKVSQAGLWHGVGGDTDAYFPFFCVLTWLFLGVFIWGGRERSQVSLLKRTLILLHQVPTFMSSFNLNYFLGVSSLNIATLGVRASMHERWGSGYKPSDCNTLLFPFLTTGLSFHALWPYYFPL